MMIEHDQRSLCQLDQSRLFGTHELEEKETAKEAFSSFDKTASGNNSGLKSVPLTQLICTIRNTGPSIQIDPVTESGLRGEFPANWMRQEKYSGNLTSDPEVHDYSILPLR